VDKPINNGTTKNPAINKNSRVIILGISI